MLRLAHVTVTNTGARPSHKKTPGISRCAGPGATGPLGGPTCRPENQAAFFLPSKNCASSVEPLSAAVEASRSTVVVTASK